MQMGGLITHLSAGLLGAIVIYFILHKLESPSKFIYGGVFILGNIIPDLVDFGILGIRMGVFDPAEIMKNPRSRSAKMRIFEKNEKFKKSDR